MTAPLVLWDLDAQGVLTLTLNRPEKLNAFTLEMIHEWHGLLLRAADDEAVKVIILTGAGRGFCAGGDATAMDRRSRNDPLEQKDFLWRHVHRIALAMERLDKPVIAAVNGVARGAGMDMALMCDIRLMARSATLAESYIAMGLAAGDGGGWYLPRIIGMDHALELLWTGRQVAAAEAERIGLATRVVEDEALLPSATELAARIAAQPQAAIRMHKRAALQGRDMPLAAHLDMVSSHMAVLRNTQEHRERVAAFNARRPAP